MWQRGSHDERADFHRKRESVEYQLPIREMSPFAAAGFSLSRKSVQSTSQVGATPSRTAVRHMVATAGRCRGSLCSRRWLRCAAVSSGWYRGHRQSSQHSGIMRRLLHALTTAAQANVGA